MLYFIVFAVLGCVAPVFAWINYTADGTATMTHYTIPEGYVASCGCTGDSTLYPTAALSQMAYGSSAAYGPGCGKCFNLTLLNSYTGTPPFFPTVTKSIVVKITDLCPLSTAGWCSGTEKKPNPSGQYLNFDLAYPSNAIPDDFFPSNATLYGYTDFGVWNITYQTVDCSSWAGWKDASALGSVAYLDSSSACCPGNPTGAINDTCPSYSDHNGLAPDTTTDAAVVGYIPNVFLYVLGALSMLL
ncbi:RlpA-like double-psi beta-barrel-protein domain-containing protein-containing protein [Mucidula mucida]|nr:RlpA-like double-psi beta-barrel-protein domain-containing protein-containing protein [Mucidula mucida]